MIKRICLLAIVSMIIGLSVGAAAGESKDWYVRGGLGFERSRAVNFSDNDSSSTNTAVLFGNVNDSNGKPLGAYGDLGSLPMAEVALGRQISSLVRADFSIQYRFGMDYDGQANFLSVGQDQPVSATAKSFSGMVNLYLDAKNLGDIGMGRFEPYIGGGAGMAYNRISKVTYKFPDNTGRHKLSVIPSGSRTDLAFMLTAGTGIILSDNVVLDISYRYQDLGKVETEQGTMVMDILPAGIQVGGTNARLRTQGVAVGIRYRF